MFVLQDKHVCVLNGKFQRDKERAKIVLASALSLFIIVGLSVALRIFGRKLSLLFFSVNIFHFYLSLFLKFWFLFFILLRCLKHYKIILTLWSCLAVLLNLRKKHFLVETFAVHIKIEFSKEWGFVFSPDITKHTSTTSQKKGWRPGR